MHQINIYSFACVYLLLLVVLLIMKITKINKAKELIFASFMMSMQLILAGYILAYLFENPYPIYTIIYIIVMLAFASRRILHEKISLNKEFKRCIAASFILCCTLIPIFFVTVITEQSFFNPQYTIPIAGMIIGNAMTGFNLALKSFQENLQNNQAKNTCLLTLGVHPQNILRPYVSSALENALYPTINSMISMGIISLPGMLTGQILAGADPSSATLYQIAIMIAISATVCISVYLGLFFGQRFLYSKQMQFTFEKRD